MIIGTTIAANKAKNNRGSGVGNNSVNTNEIKAKQKGEINRKQNIDAFEITP